MFLEHNRRSKFLSAMGQAGVSKPRLSSIDIDQHRTTDESANNGPNVPYPPSPSDLIPNAIEDVLQQNPSLVPLFQEMKENYALMERRSQKLKSQNELLRGLHDSLQRDNEQKDKELKMVVERMKQLEKDHSDAKRERMVQEAKHNKLEVQWKAKEAEYAEIIEGNKNLCSFLHFVMLTVGVCLLWCGLASRSCVSLCRIEAEDFATEQHVSNVPNL